MTIKTDQEDDPLQLRSELELAPTYRYTPTPPRGPGPMLSAMGLPTGETSTTNRRRTANPNEATAKADDRAGAAKN
jgi:hypothetical protein